MKPLEIARIIGMSERLVNEYIALIDMTNHPAIQFCDQR